ncbi:MAG: hypothetical protein RR198_08185 [Oscillospiraceae bacterium]
MRGETLTIKMSPLTLMGQWVCGKISSRLSKREFKSDGVLPSGEDI